MITTITYQRNVNLLQALVKKHTETYNSQSSQNQKPKIYVLKILKKKKKTYMVNYKIVGMTENKQISK